MRPARRDYTYQQPSSLPTVQHSQGSRAGSLLGIMKSLLILFAVVFLIVAAGMVTAWQTLPQRWLPKYDQNIVLTTDNLDVNTDIIYIFNYRQKTQEIHLHAIHAVTDVQVPGGYGKYPLRSVLPLSRLEKKSDAEIRALYSYVFGTPIDQVWSTTDQEVFSITELSDLGKFFLAQKIQGQLTLKDKIAWTWLLRRQAQQLSGTIDLESWQKKAQAQRDPATFRDCRVGIVNTTKTAGLATRAERVLNQAGATVLRVTDQDTAATSSKILYQPDNQACQALLRYLPSIFPQIIQMIPDESVFQRGRSELEIVLGEDIAKFLEK